MAYTQIVGTYHLTICNQPFTTGPDLAEVAKTHCWWCTERYIPQPP